MIRVETVLSSLPPGAAPAQVVQLAYEQRRKARQLITLDDGTELAIVLPRGVTLSPGTLLQAEDGRLIRVEAAPEAVVRVTAPDHLTLTRAAYHLGNRHTPVEISADCLRLEADPVLRDMLVRLGTRVEERNEPFEPETGAYGGGHRHGHEETFAEDYARAQRLYDEHAHAPCPPRTHAQVEPDESPPASHP